MKIGTYASKFKNCTAFMEAHVIPKGCIIIKNSSILCFYFLVFASKCFRKEP